MWLAFADRARRRELLVWGRTRGFELHGASMERLSLLYYRWAGCAVLRFLGVGAVLRGPASGRCSITR